MNSAGGDGGGTPTHRPRGPGGGRDGIGGRGGGVGARPADRR
jgi:hypothetical protein